MANKINDQRLFEYIDSLGERHGVKDSLYIDDITGQMAEGGKSYRCFVKGGILFEIHKERTTLPDWEYWVDIAWAGPFEAVDSDDIVSTLLWLKHKIPKNFDSTNLKQEIMAKHCEHSEYPSYYHQSAIEQMMDEFAAVQFKNELNG